MINSSNHAIAQRDRFPVKIKCPKCGHTGSATWEENSTISARGPMASLEGLSDGFYQRTTEPPVGIPEVVCAKCETVLAV